MQRLGCALLAACAIALAQPEAEIRRILADRIDRDRQSLGIVAATLDGDGRRHIVAYGDLKPDSLFEIGSITKVFTALLLADAVERAEVSIDDPVAKFLPADVPVPRNITLRHLAMHTSGLPRVPTNLSPKLLANPYVDYTAAKLYDFLRAWKPDREPGVKWEYSNLGAGLLGHVLERRTGIDYGTLVRLRVCGPLDMLSTHAVLPGTLRSRAAQAHNAALQPTPNWGWDVLAGAGALWSGADDLLDFLEANLGLRKTWLAPAMEAMRQPRFPIAPGMAQALGWQVTTRDGADLFWKDGGTFGFASFIGFDPKSKRAAVVLSDAFAPVADIGLHLLDARIPLRERTK